MRLLALLLLASPLVAHEFWLEPSRHLAAPGDTVDLALRVGMDLQGEPRPFRRDRAAALRHYTAAGVTDLLPLVPAPPGTTALPLTLAAGTHLLCLDTAANLIELDPAKFADYLREEGLDAVLAARTAAGQADRPGRERYQRCVKTLLRAGPHSDATYALHTGQRLELVPQADPFAIAPGATLAFKLIFDGQPLADALILAWHRDRDQLIRLEARTAADGSASFTLPRAGRWMISTVHMLPLAGDPAADWQSYWSSLTFALPAP